MIALPLSGYMIRGQTNINKQSIKRTLRYMRIFNCIAFISLLSFFMECDDTRYYYLGGDLNYDQLEVNTTWIPSGKFVTILEIIFRCNLLQQIVTKNFS